MEQWILFYIRVEVTLFICENFNVGSEDCWGGHSFCSHDQYSLLINFDGQAQYECQDEKQSGANAFDSLTVKIYVWKFIVFGLFDDDSWNQVPRNDEEDVNSDESSSRHEVGESMRNKNSRNGDRPQTIDVWSIRCSLILKLLLI